MTEKAPFNAPRLVKTLPPDPHLEIKTPRCPLCHEDMARELRRKHNSYVFACKRPGCEIAVRVDDPFVGRWDEGQDIPCPNPRCPKAPDSRMRYFATRTGYMKAVCPTCRAAMTNMEPDRKKDTPDKTYTPENPGVMQQ